jgi:hypothetical protein
VKLLLLNGSLAVFLLASSTVAASAGELRIHITDETGTPVWTRLEVRGADGKNYQPRGALRDLTAGNREGGLTYYLDSFIVQGEASLGLPPGRYTIVAEHGLEYEREERTVDVTDSPVDVALRLKPWIRMSKLGWWSGDMHIHRPIEDSAALALAEDLNISVVFTMWNKRNLWEGKHSLPEPAVRVSPNHVLTVMNAEDERGGGAWMMHSIRRPLELGVDGRWYPPGITFVRQALAERSGNEILPWFDCEKPVWWEVPVMMALATPDSFGVLHNHFNQYGIHTSEAWGRPRDQQQYPGRKGFVDYSLSLYYRYLNLGFRLPASAGSASGVLPNPAGYNRIYVRMPGALTVEKWYAALHNGMSFVTNGPVLFFSVKQSGSRAHATVEARAREMIDRIEIVANGSIIKTFSVAPGSLHLKGEFDFPVNSYSWVAARCFLKTDVTIRLGHSSPVYLPGRWDARADAVYFLDWIDELIGQASADPNRFASESQRDEVLALYRKAREFYAARAQ